MATTSIECALRIVEQSRPMNSKLAVFAYIACLPLFFPLPAGAHEDKPQARAARTETHAAALGKPGDVGQVSRTVQVEMNDAMRFVPSSIEVRRGETIRFVVKNSGRLKHEMVLGTRSELRAHAALMRKFPEMEHADPNQESVGPGAVGELVWQFTRNGRFDFACLQPGHYEAGMKGTLRVAR